MRVFLIILTLLSLLSCSSYEESSNYSRHDYSEIKHLTISYLDVFKMEKDRYYIYYYQENCYYCMGIKSKVIEYALNYEGAFFFINIEKDEGFLSNSREDTIMTNDPLKAFCLMTPQLSIVEGGYIIETFLGDEEVINELYKN